MLALKISWNPGVFTSSNFLLGNSFFSCRGGCNTPLHEKKIELGNYAYHGFNYTVKSICGIYLK
jgi:hypothetical protein